MYQYIEISILHHGQVKCYLVLCYGKIRHGGVQWTLMFIIGLLDIISYHQPKLASSKNTKLF